MDTLHRKNNDRTLLIPPEEKEMTCSLQIEMENIEIKQCT